LEDDGVHLLFEQITAMKQQKSKFCSQIQGIDASHAAASQHWLLHGSSSTVLTATCFVNGNH